jgi:IS5 family transposase
MFKQINQNSFFGNFLYEKVVPSNHFLRKLSQVVDLSFVNNLCKNCYPNLGKAGNRPYEPMILFKELLIAFLYDISDREIEEQVNLNLAFKWFVGLPADGLAPDHSTLSYFRERLGVKRFEQIFNQIVKQTRDKNLIDDKLKIIDSTHIQAKVDTNRLTKKFKENLEKEPDDLDNNNINKSNHIDKTSPDKDARFGRKSDAKKFYGYKQHIIMDGNSEIIEKVETTPGNVKDEKKLESLMEGVQPKEKCKTRQKPKILTDKGYDCNYNHQVIEEKHQCQSFIMLKKNRKDKKFKRKMKSKLYQAVIKQRYKVERRFADGKNNHGLGKCRWLGQFKTDIQSYLTATVLNCKRIVTLLSQSPEYCLQTF